MNKTAACTLAMTLVVSSATAQPVPPSPKDFVTGALQSDQYEILAATIATTQSHDPRVVKFAQMMIRDHARLSADMLTAARASHVPPPDPGISSDQAGMLSALQSMRGPEFDKSYVKQQILAHTQALAVETSFASRGADANLRKAGRSAVPTIETHLRMGRQLSDELGS